MLAVSANTTFMRIDLRKHCHWWPIWDMENLIRIFRLPLRRLVGFRFRESDLCNLPSWRMRAIEEIIQERVQILLAM